MREISPDLSTVYGRLQWARYRQGYEQDDFADKMNFSRSGWGKIERGERNLTADLLVKANTILKLDWRYYFGEFGYDDAAKNTPSKVEDLANEWKEFKKYFNPTSEIDPVAKAVMDKPALKKHVEKIQEWSPEMIERFTEWAIVYYQGRQDEKIISLKKGTAV